MTCTAHLTALISRLSNERARLAAATNQGEIELRTVWVRQCEKEVNGEERFLGMEETDFTAPQMTDAELMAELAGR